MFTVLKCRQSEASLEFHTDYINIQLYLQYSMLNKFHLYFSNIIQYLYNADNLCVCCYFGTYLVEIPKFFLMFVCLLVVWFVLTLQYPSTIFSKEIAAASDNDTTSQMLKPNKQTLQLVISAIFTD